MMMKRLLDESKSVAKRIRLSESIEIAESIISSSSSSQTEQDDHDHIEIVDRTCQSPLVIILDSESDDERSISPSFNGSVQTFHEEVIDLTEDEEPTSSSSTQLERQSSIDTQECPICLENLSDLQSSGVYLLITQCRHIMCMLCTQQLLAIAPRCPLCRAHVSSTNLMSYCILT